MHNANHGFLAGGRVSRWSGALKSRTSRDGSVCSLLFHNRGRPAPGDFRGPLENEIRAWLDHLVTGAPTAHTTPEQARINLETTIAIERAAASGKPVRLPLAT
jgi:predicted dehydrogenase